MGVWGGGGVRGSLVKWELGGGESIFCAERNSYKFDLTEVQSYYLVYLASIFLSFIFCLFILCSLNFCVPIIVVRNFLFCFCVSKFVLIVFPSEIYNSYKVNKGGNH